MPALATKPSTVRGIARPSPAGTTTGKRPAARRNPTLLSHTLQRIMEVEPLVEEVVEVVSEEMTAKVVEPQCHEVELMSIPVNSYVKTETEEAMPPANEEKNEDVTRRRLSSETSDHQRRINRGDSEVQIEEILTRVFEDITMHPKPESKKVTSKSRSPATRRPPLPKPTVPRAAPKPKPTPMKTVVESKVASPTPIKATPRQSPLVTKPALPKFNLKTTVKKTNPVADKPQVVAKPQVVVAPEPPKPVEKPIPVEKKATRLTTAVTSAKTVTTAAKKTNTVQKKLPTK